MAPDIYLTPLVLESITQMLRENDHIRKGLHDYLAARSKIDRIEAELDALKSEWGMACVPNTDTERTYAFYAECKRLEDELHYTRIVEAVAYDALFAA
jgi:hypothetical protein